MTEWFAILPIVLCCGLPLLLFFFGRRRGGEPKDQALREAGGLNALLDENTRLAECLGADLSAQRLLPRR